MRKQQPASCCLLGGGNLTTHHSSTFQGASSILSQTNAPLLLLHYSLAPSLSFGRARDVIRSTGSRSRGLASHPTPPRVPRPLLSMPRALLCFSINGLALHPIPPPCSLIQSQYSPRPTTHGQPMERELIQLQPIHPSASIHPWRYAIRQRAPLQADHLRQDGRRPLLPPRLISADYVLLTREVLINSSSQVISSVAVPG